MVILRFQELDDQVHYGALEAVPADSGLVQARLIGRNCTGIGLDEGLFDCSKIVR